MKSKINLMCAAVLITLFVAGCKKDDAEPDPATGGGTPTCNDGAHTGYTSVVTDPCSDGDNTALLDGTRLEFKYDVATDSIWFLVSVNSLTATQNLGVNIMVNIPGGGSTFDFWGTQNTAAYHKLLTVWARGTAPSNYNASAPGDYIGIADATGVNGGNFNNLYSYNISIYADVAAKTIRLGLKRTDLITDLEFPGNTITIKAAAAVGVDTSWNDDLFSSSASMTLNKTTCNDAAHAGFTTVTADACGDENNTALLDGTRLEYKYDEASDSLWFLVSVNELSSSQPIGVNVMVNIQGGGGTFNFWGTDNTAAYTKLLTVWVTGSAPSSYTGTIGISDNTGVNGANFTNLSQNNISINANVADKTILLGLKRTDLVTDSEFPGTTITLNTAAAVGANDAWNDDIYNASATITLTKSAPAITDIDGNVYTSVAIGTQTWMVENLKTTRYRNGDPIANLSDSASWVNTTSGAYCYYNNSSGNNAVYGKLYNRYAVGDSRNIAPAGWHVPTLAEYLTLFTYLDTALCGSKLKEAGTAHWNSPNAATNETGFTAEPGGDCFGGFYDIGDFYVAWCSDLFDASHANCVWIDGPHAHAHHGSDQFMIGLSVRLVKD